MSAEARKAAWERNPPKHASTRDWRTPDQIAADTIRKQISDERKKEQRLTSKQKRKIKAQIRDATMEDRKALAEGKRWDVRTARWIEPIEAALKPNYEEGKMTAKKKAKTGKRVKKEATGTNGKDETFGLRKDSNYGRMMNCLNEHLGDFVKLPIVARAAYDTSSDLEKHCRRVVTMARRVQEKIINQKNLNFEIKKERKENEIYIGLFRK